MTASSSRPSSSRPPPSSQRGALASVSTRPRPSLGVVVSAHDPMERILDLAKTEHVSKGMIASTAIQALFLVAMAIVADWGLARWTHQIQSEILSQLRSDYEIDITKDETPPPPPPADYTAPPAVVVRPEIPPPPPYDLPPPPPPEPISRAHEWGLNLHLDGAAFGHGAGHAGMGGAGAGLRFKPNRRFGIETDVDITGGTDYQGASRTETAFTINGLLFLNPRSRAQFYILAGFGWSGANVSGGSTNGSYGSGSGGGQYTYFGGQLGGGLELRLCRALALNADVRGFIRTRVDSAAQSQPEFVDAYGRSTNTSGGALFTGGMTIYF